MWKSPKMVLFVLLTAGLYAGSIFPFHGLTAFGGYADFGRVGVGVPVAFSFLFGPAAAWGAAIGNVLRDIIENHVDASSYFGFIGNFILGYAPYKIWTTLTAQKPDLRSLKKLALFLGISVASCLLCGLVIGWELYWLGYTPFMPTAAIIGLTNALWVVTVGAAVLAAYVYSLDNKRLWSNLDCAPSNETLVKEFEPGEQVTTEVTWTGMGSAPNCPLPREPIGPGTYNLVVQLGNLRSATVPFVLAEAAPPGEAPPPADAPLPHDGSGQAPGN
jgi:hypothetical protein